jgi:hypothetical protein
MAVAAPTNPTDGSAFPSPPLGSVSGPAGPTGAGADLASAIEVIASFVSSFEPERFSGEDAATLVTWFTRAERLCAAGRTKAAARVAESPRHAQLGHRTPAEWLASVTGESLGQAQDDLQLASTLAEHPEVDEAYREGRLSRSGAKLVAEAVRVNPNREGDLLHGAEHETLRQLRQRCLRAKAEAQSNEDAEKAYAAIRAKRRCRTWTDREGAFHLEALLTPDAGASVAASLAAQAARHFEEARRSGLRESRDNYTADALVALVTGEGILQKPKAGTRGPGTGGPGTRGSGTGGPGSRNAAGAEAATETDTQPDPDTDHQPDPDTDSGPEPDTDSGSPTSRGGPRALVHLRVDLDALRSGSLRPGGTCEIPGVGPVSIQTARDLMGDAICDLVITNGCDVATVCHLGRSIPTALRTALVERDRTCVIPGCDVAQGLEIDHWDTPFAEGGPTRLSNLARLCKHHHYLRTHRGFRLSGGPGNWRWEPPSIPKPNANRKRRGDRGRSTPGPTKEPGRTGTFDPPLFTIEE